MEAKYLIILILLIVVSIVMYMIVKGVLNALE